MALGFSRRSPYRPTPEQNAPLVKGATDLLSGVPNKLTGLMFEAIQEGENEDWTGRAVYNALIAVCRARVSFRKC